MPSTLFILLFTVASFIGNLGNDITVPAIQVIKITGSDASTGTLTLEDVNGNPADNFQIAAGSKIQWLVKSNSIKDVTNIYAKPDNPNVFSDGPQRRGKSQNWGGQIDDNAGGQEESYNIDWVDESGNGHTYDPKIQVK